MDVDFQKLKREVEAELGRSLDGEETHLLRGLLYFGRGLKVRRQLEAASEPVHISQVLPAVMAGIKSRMMRRRREKRQRRISRAVGDSLGSPKPRARRAGTKERKTNGTL